MVDQMESVVICVDNSESISKEYLESQIRVIEFVCKAIFRSNPKNEVSIITSSPEPKIKNRFSKDFDNISEILKLIQSEGQMSLRWTLTNSFGYLCQTVGTKRRILLFVHSLLTDEECCIRDTAQELLHVFPELIVDIISFGINEELNSTKLKALYTVFSQNNESNLYEIETTDDCLIWEALKRTTLLNISDEDYDVLKTAINCGQSALSEDMFTDADKSEDKELMNAIIESIKDSDKDVYRLSRPQDTTTAEQSQAKGHLYLIELSGSPAYACPQEFPQNHEKKESEELTFKKKVDKELAKESELELESDNRPTDINMNECPDVDKVSKN